MLFLIALGCTSPTEAIRGTIRMGPGTTAPPAAGATVTIYDQALQLHDQTVTEVDGTFEVRGPRGETVFAEISGSDLVRAGFVGAVGQGPFEVPDGDLFAFEVDRLNTLRSRFEGCASSEGGVIHGEFRLFGATGDEGSPIVRTGFARLLTGGDDKREACYLDDAGLSWNEDSSISGETGQYAFFGVEPGLHEIEYGYFIQDFEVLHYIVVYVPEDGIAAQFPAWVDLVTE